jgi:hypothetical protein
MQNYCAPDKEAQESFRQTKTCFTLSSLQKLARAWNERASRLGLGEKPITDIPKKNKQVLWRELNGRMKDHCALPGKNAGGAQEGCWVDKLSMEEHSEPSQDLRYPKPAKWYANPRMWLNNFDIEDVMEQYEREPSFQYNFLGVYPMDFADIYTELNDLKWSGLTKGGTCKYIGMITNLDDHDEPGSHWTSFFAVLDPRLPSFGAYYYDSVSVPPTKEIKAFMVKLMVKTLAHWLAPRISATDLAKMMAFPFEKYNGVEIKAFTHALHEMVRAYPGGVKEILPFPFKLEYNTHQHQYKNTECGVFSMVYQIRWLEGLKADPKTTFDRVVQHKMRDDEIHRFRDILFRPNGTVAAAKPAKQAKPAKPVKDKPKNKKKEAKVV